MKLSHAKATLHIINQPSPIIPFKTSIEMRNILKSYHAGKQVSTVHGGKRVHRFQRCRHNSSVPGGTARTVHRHGSRIRSDTFRLEQGGKGAARLQHRTQTGLVHQKNYTPDIQKDDLSFLSRSFERHFNERPFLNHTCYLFLTKTTKERSRMRVIFPPSAGASLSPKR